jgi:hypothetical protein
MFQLSFDADSCCKPDAGFENYTNFEKTIQLKLSRHHFDYKCLML